MNSGVSEAAGASAFAESMYWAIRTVCHVYKAIPPTIVRMMSIISFLLMMTLLRMAMAMADKFARDEKTAQLVAVSGAMNDAANLVRLAVHSAVQRGVALFEKRDPMALLVGTFRFAFDKIPRMAGGC